MLILKVALLNFVLNTQSCLALLQSELTEQILSARRLSRESPPVDNDGRAGFGSNAPGTAVNTIGFRVHG